MDSLEDGEATIVMSGMRLAWLLTQANQVSKYFHTLQVWFFSEILPAPLLITVTIIINYVYLCKTQAKYFNLHNVGKLL